MSAAFTTYLRITALSGSIATAFHGYKEREKRMRTPSDGPARRTVPLSLNAVGVLRDGLVGALIGPIAAPFVVPVLLVLPHPTKCPFSGKGAPSDLF